jgi:hypothetical protein
MKICTHIAFCMIILSSCKTEIKHNGSEDSAIKEEKAYIILSREEYYNHYIDDIAK